MAQNTEQKKKGSFVGTLILMLLAFVAGGVVGRTQIGWMAENTFNTLRYSRTPVAESFLNKPFGLDIAYQQNDQGELETYLLNLTNNEMLPIYEVNGTTQVGDAKHRMIGLKDQLLKDAEEGGSAALEKAKQLLDFLDR